MPRAVLASLLGLALAGCAARPLPVKAPLGPPTAPLPPVLAQLGEPCTGDTTTRAPGRSRMREIDTTCGASGRTSVVDLDDYVTITGRHFAPGYDLDDDPYFKDAWKGSVVFPTTVLARVTSARSRRGQDVNEVTVYADGWRLWVESVHEHLEQFPTARLLIVDRRYLTARDERRVRALLQLPDDLAIDDDDALRRSLARWPSLPPGKDGELR